MRVLVLLLLAASLAGCVASEAPKSPGFTGGGTWLNSEPLALDELQGKVVLVDFWTYSCINCIRTLPHLTAWDETYREHGLVIVGVHSPEFDFEKETANVEFAIDKYSVQYAVVQDNDHTIWRAWDQKYWPAKYIFNQDGEEVYHHFGEGQYFETENVIRELLAAAGAELPDRVESQTGGPPNVPRTRELYAGTWRQADALGPGQTYEPEQWVVYELPEERPRDFIYLEGNWFNGHEFLELDGAGAVVLPFRAGAANFVGDGVGCVQVRLNGTPAANWGPDVDSDGCIRLDGARSYDFYAGDWGSHEVRFDVPDGFELYTFAFSGTANQ